MHRQTKALQAEPPIHYVVWEALPGGMESYITRYTEHLEGRRSTYIYSLRPSGNHLNPRLNGHFAEGSRNNWACYTGFFRYARRYRRDVFHFINSGPVVLLLALLAGVRRPVYHIHGTKHWKTWKDRLYLKAAWRLVGLFRVRYVANSEHSAAIFERDALPLRPRVVYNGFDLQRFLQHRHRRMHLRRMAYVGRLDPDKNAHLVLRLFEELAAQRPEVELHIAGSGALEADIRRQAQQSPFAHRIFFYGWIEDVARFYAEADLFVFLSAHESFGNVVAEGLLTGLPVLTSDVPVFEEIHGDTTTFCLGNPNDYAQIRQRFWTALEDYAALAQKAYDAAERLQRLFDIKTHLKDIEEVYANP
ncbi:MAG: glycosyltransferase [Saprospiraceae bacterium]|nr:glycosyltransferase [Saprospiraceae bacterium]MDW8229302.1 glycosyltransferase [Saprospiraceae bacterium]